MAFHWYPKRPTSDCAFTVPEPCASVTWLILNRLSGGPRTVNLPDAAPVPEQERDRFSSHTVNMLALLDQFKEQPQLALAR